MAHTKHDKDDRKTRMNLMIVDGGGREHALLEQLRKNPRVAQIIEEIRAETGKSANIDTDELLGELEE